MIQIDIPMPKNCADCCFATADLVNGIITLFCMTPTGRKMYAPDLISRKDRPEWCPLKEQEAVVHPEPSCEMTYITDCCCDLCGVQLIREDNFCRCCGKRIEWERR